MSPEASLDAPTDPGVSVIIVAYNAGAFLQPCLEALSKQTYSDFECLIVDNGSTDGAVATATLPDRRFRVIDAGENLGFAVANNRAAQQAQAPWIACLNPDAYAEPDWLQALITAAHVYGPRGFDMFGSTQIDAQKPDLLDGAGDCYHASGIAWRGLNGHPTSHLPKTAEVFAPCAAASLYRTQAFRQVGGFAESFFCYHEDVDLAFRLRLRGGRCLQVAEAVVHHEGSGITGRTSDFSIYHGVRNRIWTFVRCMPGVLFWALLPAHIAANLVHGAVWCLRGRWRVFGRAYRDALMGLGVAWQQRQLIQKTRTTSLSSVARVLTWDPRLAFKREVKTQEVRHDAG